MELPEKIDIAKHMISRGHDVDTVLTGLGLSHVQYRKVYPSTPVSPGLALDIMDARDLDKLSLNQIRQLWSLNKSQLHYALYNSNAMEPVRYAGPREQVVQALLESGKECSQTALAEEFGVSQSFVHRLAKELGCLSTTRKERVILSSQQWAEIRQLVKTKSVASIAKQYNVSRNAVYDNTRGDK
jgi:predicted transcriptional regulator